MKDGTFTEPLVLGKMMNDSHSQLCVCVCVYTYMWLLRVTCKEEAVIDGGSDIVMPSRHVLMLSAAVPV